MGVVPVPDDRLPQIADTIQPDKITPASIEFVDIAGLVKNAHQGEGLGNQFLGQIRNCRVLIEVVRGFPSESVSHVEGDIDPERDMELIQTELLMKDVSTVQKSLKKHPALRPILRQLQVGTPIRDMDLTDEQKDAIENFQLLTQKPILRVLNGGSDEEFDMNLALKIEEELSEMTPQERDTLGIRSKLPKLIRLCYKRLDLITFYTVEGGKEVRAWSIKRGSTAPQAGGIVHSDFETGFIKAEVVKWDNLVDRDWAQSRAEGLTKTVGRDYIIQDREVIEFKCNYTN